MADEIRIQFIDEDPGTAGSLAQSLRAEILDQAPLTNVTRIAQDPRSMDPGTILAIIMGSSATTAIAHGIASWLAQHAGVKLRILTSSGMLLADNVTSKDAPRLVAAAMSHESTSD